MTTASASSVLPDKDQIRVHVRRDGSIERQRFNGRVWRQLCKYDGGEECQAFVAYRSLCVGHYHQTSGITVNESKRRQLIQQSTAAVMEKTTMRPSKFKNPIQKSDTLDHGNYWNRTDHSNASILVKKQSSQTSPIASFSSSSNKRRISNEWVLLKRFRYGSTHNIPRVQSILSSLPTIIDESVSPSSLSQAPSVVTTMNNHRSNYILSQNSIVISASRLTDEQMDRLEQFLRRFTIHYSDEVDENTTHLITDDSEIPFVCALSSKVVHALARHLTVLSMRWIDESLLCDELLLGELALQFEIRGDLTCSTMYHGGMQRSRLIPRRHSLFSKHIFMLKCNGVQNLMDNQELRSLIALCGGHTCSSLRTDQVTRWTAQGRMIIVLCEQSYVQERQDKYWKCVELGIRFCSPEFIIESIAQYQVQDYSIYDEAPQPIGNESNEEEVN